MKTIEANKNLIGRRCECIFTGMMATGVIEDIKGNKYSVNMKLIPKYQTGKDILPIDWRPRSELDSKYNLGSKSYGKTGQVSG